MLWQKGYFILVVDLENLFLLSFSLNFSLHLKLFHVLHNPDMQKEAIIYVVESFRSLRACSPWHIRLLQLSSWLITFRGLQSSASVKTVLVKMQEHIRVVQLQPEVLLYSSFSFTNMNFYLTPSMRFRSLASYTSLLKQISVTKHITFGAMIQPGQSFTPRRRFCSCFWLHT